MNIHQDLLGEYHRRQEIRAYILQCLEGIHKLQKIVLEMLEEGSEIDPSTLKDWLVRIAYGQEQTELLLHKLWEDEINPQIRSRG